MKLFCGVVEAVTERAVLCKDEEGEFWLPKSAMITEIDWGDVVRDEYMEFEYHSWFVEEYL